MSKVELTQEQQQKALGLLHAFAHKVEGERKDFERAIIDFFIELGEDDMCWNCMHDKFPGDGCYECGCDKYGIRDKAFDTYTFAYQTNEGDTKVVSITSSTEPVGDEDEDEDEDEEVTF